MSVTRILVPNYVMTRPEFLYGTTNSDKLHEAQALAASFGIQLKGLAAAVRGTHRGPPMVVEDSSVYEGNAVRKALAYAVWGEMPCFADDTGLEIAEIGGYPGVYTARVGVHALRERLAAGRQYEARFVCCVAYAQPNGRRIAVTATLPGIFVPSHEVQASRTTLEFSPYFIPAGQSRSLRDLLEDGYADSHRARAFRTLLHAMS